MIVRVVMRVVVCVVAPEVEADGSPLLSVVFGTGTGTSVHPAYFGAEPYTIPRRTA